MNHPDVIADVDITELVDVMLGEAEAFFSSADEALRRRKYRIGLELIMDYLDDYGPESDDFLTATSGWGGQFLRGVFRQASRLAAY